MALLISKISLTYRDRDGTRSRKEDIVLNNVCGSIKAGCIKGEAIHLRVFLSVHNRRNGNPKIRYRAPEICTQAARSLRHLELGRRKPRARTGGENVVQHGLGTYFRVEGGERCRHFGVVRTSRRWGGGESDR